MKRAIVILLILAAATAAARYFYPRYARRPAPDNTLRVSGNIEAHESVLSFKVPGRIVALPVEEGQWLKTGAVIARLDNDDYRQQVAVDDSAIRTRDAELTLSLAGTREQQIREAEQAVIDAKADLDQKQLDLKRDQALFEKDEVSAETRDLAATAMKRAQAAYERTQQAYNEALEGTRKEQIAINRANLRLAEQNLQMSRIRLDYTVLHAPQSGVILVRQAELGEVMAPGTPVVTLADLDNVWLRAYVSETDLGRIHWGQAATLRTDTYPDKIYQGRISFISSEAEFTPKSVETYKERVTLVYRIKIDVANPRRELKPGMPADAVIETQP